MKSVNRQRGWSTSGLLMVLLMVAFVSTCVIKLVPVYLEKNTVKTAIQNTIDDGGFDGLSVGATRRKLSKIFELNSISAIHFRDVEVVRDKGSTIIDASYEQRVPFMQNIDVVVKFEKLQFKYRTAN